MSWHRGLLKLFGIHVFLISIKNILPSVSWNGNANGNGNECKCNALISSQIDPSPRSNRPQSNRPHVKTASKWKSNRPHISNWIKNYVLIWILIFCWTVNTNQIPLNQQLHDHIPEIPKFFLQPLLKIHFKTFTKIHHSQWFIDKGYVNLVTKNSGSTWKNDTWNAGFGH